MGFITWRHILKQLVADGIGKDSHRGVTLTYTWLANQFGHISLGFIPTLILYVFLKNNFEITNPIVASISISVIWLLFETYNFLGPLLRKKRSKFNFMFHPDFKNVGFDTFTDVCFFTFGAFLCGYYIAKSGLTSFFKLNLPVSFTLLFVLAIVLVFFSKYWFVTKMFQNYAQYPFQFRLSQWNKKIAKVDAKKIEAYKNRKNSGNHLLIFGGNSSGKTSLAVGLANELSIKKHACLYTTAFKLFTNFYEINKNIDPTKQIWEWHNCEYLVIDDINPGEPIKKDIVTTEDFLYFLDREQPTVNLYKNRENLKNKNIIWVLGNNINKRLESEWVTMLNIELNIDLNKIETVNL